MSEKKEVTSVHEVDINIDEILGFDTDTVMLPGETAAEPKKNVFSKMDIDTTFLDRPQSKEAPKSVEVVKDETIDPDAPVVPEIKKDIIDENADDDANDIFAQPSPDDDLDYASNKGGRPSALVTAAKKLIEKGRLMPFEDDKKIEDYTAEDFEELIEANFESFEARLTGELPAQFFEQMPAEMQQAYEYIAQGGTDLKGMFSALAQSRETADLDITSENGQKSAIRSYLSATGFGTPEEIEDEIYAYDDRGDLEKKANQFKPKLDAMQQQVVQKRIKAQEAQTALRKDQSQKYIESVYSTLEEGKLNGTDIDNKVQNMLYAGLVQSNYPSVSGKQTNMLGHLLEKYQWVEPRHDLIAEALWLLADPDGYKTKIKSGQVQETNAATLRKLKTEQSSKSNTSTETEEVSAPVSRKRSTGVLRPKKNFFGYK